MPEQLMLEVKCSWVHIEVCVLKKKKKRRKKREAQKWSMSLSTAVCYAGTLDKLSLWLGGKTSLSDVALQSPDHQRGASAIAGPQLARVRVARRRIAQVYGSQ